MSEFNKSDYIFWYSEDPIWDDFKNKEKYLI